MRTLILLRHGEAAPAGADGDSARPLTPKGRRDAAAAGKALAALGVHIDLALVSPARRTQETWASASAAFDAAPSRGEPALLHSAASTVLAAARAAGEQTVLVVGHNPGLGELVDQLARQSDRGASHGAFARAGFPPASAAVFTCAGEAWSFDAFLPPESQG